MGNYSKIWPMLQGTKNTAKREIYKCTQCGGESHPERGHNGAPSLHNCKPGCPCRQKAEAQVGNKAQFNATFDQIFPNAPGAGI